MNSLTGTAALVRMALRRDRIRLPVWILSITAMVLLVAGTLGDLYPTEQARLQLARTVGANPALEAMLGPVFDASVGGLVAWRLSFASLVLVPLMAIFAVVRHTRAEEEAGRLELLGSTVLGRRAPLAAALIVAWGASGVLGVGVAVGLVAYGEDVVGSAALGLAYALSGCVFAAVAAVCAQLSENTRTVTGAAAAVLGISFLARSAGSAAAGLDWLAWTSPSGWVLEIRPFAAERWWVAGLLLGLALGLTALADRLTVRRDLEAGLLAPRHGSAEAAAWLRGPVGLAWRLHRLSLLGWSVGLFALGAMYGSVAASVGQLLEQTPQLEEVFRAIGGEQALVNAYFSTTMLVAGFVTAGFAVHTVLRLRAEETGLRAEYVLATTVHRTPWALAHVGVAVGGAVVLLAAMGLGAALTHGLRVGDLSGEAARLIPSAVVQLPAVLVVAALALLLVGALPRATGLVWAALVGFLVLGQLGALLRLDQRLIDLSPFTHLPALPGGQVSAAPLLALVAVAVALGAAGLVGLRLRDIGR